MNDLDHDTPPEGTQERAAPLDLSELSSLDRTRLGPNGEKPWIPEDDPPKPTIEWLEYQYKLYSKNRAVIGIPDVEATDVVGTFRELTPCPRSGKISFKQIGDIRLKTKDIFMNDEDLLVCRRPVANGVDSNKEPKFEHEEPTNDPSDYYRALWGHGYDIYRGEVLPMNPLESWNEGFSPPYPTSSSQEDYGFSRRGVQVLENDSGEYFRLYNSSYGEYVFLGYYGNGNPAWGWRYWVRATYAVCYIGRIEPGTRLEWCVDVYKPNGDWRTEGASFQIRGWSEGFFGGDSMDYENIGFRQAGSSGDWRCYSGEITVDERFNDLWLAFQQNGSDNTTNYQNVYFRNFQFWRS